MCSVAQRNACPPLRALVAARFEPSLRDMGYTTLRDLVRDLTSRHDARLDLLLALEAAGMTEAQRRKLAALAEAEASSNAVRARPSSESVPAAIGRSISSLLSLSLEPSVHSAGIAAAMHDGQASRGRRVSFGGDGDSAPPSPQHKLQKPQLRSPTHSPATMMPPSPRSSLKRDSRQSSPAGPVTGPVAAARSLAMDEDELDLDEGAVGIAVGNNENAVAKNGSGKGKLRGPRGSGGDSTMNRRRPSPLDLGPSGLRGIGGPKSPKSPSSPASDVAQSPKKAPLLSGLLGRTQPASKALSAVEMAARSRSFVRSSSFSGDLSFEPASPKGPTTSPELRPKGSISSPDHLRSETPRTPRKGSTGGDAASRERRNDMPRSLTKRFDDAAAKTERRGESPRMQRQSFESSSRAEPKRDSSPRSARRQAAKSEAAEGGFASLVDPLAGFLAGVGLNDARKPASTTAASSREKSGTRI